MIISINERVENGVKMLDENRPGWWEIVDLSRLNIKCLNDCILGQVYGDWTAGTAALNLEDRHEQCLNGFEMTHEEYVEGDCESVAEAIEAAWATSILTRQVIREEF